MSNINDFLPFCPTNTGTNLESQADYLVDTSRTDGNQPVLRVVHSIIKPFGKRTISQVKWRKW